MEFESVTPERFRTIDYDAIKTVDDVVKILRLFEFNLHTPVSKITKDLEYLFLKEK